MLVAPRLTRTNKAFSLVEVLVAVAILGIIVGIAMPAWGKARLSANQARRDGNLHLLNSAADRATLDDNGRNFYYTNPATGTTTSTWVPNWPRQFVDPIPTTQDEKNARASNVMGYFVTKGYIEQGRAQYINLDGVGYDASGYFIPIDFSR